MRVLPFTLSMISLLGFGFALIHPNFTYSEFSFPPNPYLDKADRTLDSPCTLLKIGLEDGDFLSQSNKERLNAYCKEYEPKLKKTSYKILDHSLGTIEHDGNAQSWESCLSKDDQQFSRCVSLWSATKAGMPTGHRSLMNIISKTIKNDVPIGAMLFIFAVIFPVLRLILFILYQLNNSVMLAKLHTYCKKWSMTEVLTLSLLITFTKAHQFSFAIILKEAGWAFIGASIILFVSELTYPTRKPKQ